MIWNNQITRGHTLTPPFTGSTSSLAIDVRLRILACIVLKLKLKTNTHGAPISWLTEQNNLFIVDVYKYIVKTTRRTNEGDISGVPKFSPEQDFSLEVAQDHSREFPYC